jgi:hypothetical protein
MAPPKGSKRVKKVREPLNFGAITFGTVEPGFGMRMARPTRGVRDDEQKVLDDLVMKAWEAWDASGRPEAWDDTPGQLITVPTKMEKVKNQKTGKDEEHDVILETVIWRIRRSGIHYDFKIRLGDITREDGYSSVVFIATDKPVGESDEDETDEDAEAREDENETDDDGVVQNDQPTDTDQPAWAST